MTINIKKFVTVTPGPMTPSPLIYWMRVYDFNIKKWKDWEQVSYSTHFEWELKNFPYVQTVSLPEGLMP